MSLPLISGPVCILPRLKVCHLCGEEKRRDELYEMKTLDALVCRDRIKCHRRVAGGERG